MTKLTVGAVTVATIMLVGVLAPWVAPGDPNLQDLRERFRPPVWAAGGTAGRPLGTDQFGRDVLSRIAYGARISLWIATASILLSGVAGTAVGLLAGTVGGVVERLFLQLIDAQSALPPVLLAIIAAAVLGPSVTNLILILGVTGWALFARVVYGQTLSLREREYVTAARALGASSARILARHLLPNLVSTLSVLGALQVGRMILMESSLSFLGVGVPLTTPSWGGMLADARTQLWVSPWLTMIPGAAIGVTVWALTIAGDGLRARLGGRVSLVT